MQAIVTGARTGIGRAIADRLLREGWDVLGISRSDEGVLIDPCYTHFILDIRQPDKYHRICDSGAITKQPDLVVHCAGARIVGRRESFRALLNEALDIDVLGTIEFCKWCLNQWEMSRHITFGWEPGDMGRELQTETAQIYRIVKGGIAAWSDQMGIHCIKPGFVRDESYWIPNDSFEKRVVWQRPTAIAEEAWDWIEMAFDPRWRNND